LPSGVQLNVELPEQKVPVVPMQAEGAAGHRQEEFGNAPPQTNPDPHGPLDATLTQPLLASARQSTRFPDASQSLPAPPGQAAGGAGQVQRARPAPPVQVCVPTHMVVVLTTRQPLSMPQVTNPPDPWHDGPDTPLHAAGGVAGHLHAPFGALPWQVIGDVQGDAPAITRQPLVPSMSQRPSWPSVRQKPPALPLHSAGMLVHEQDALPPLTVQGALADVQGTRLVIARHRSAFMPQVATD
jgi:hypothetical protein